MANKKPLNAERQMVCGWRYCANFMVFPPSSAGAPDTLATTTKTKQLKNKK